MWEVLNRVVFFFQCNVLRSFTYKVTLFFCDFYDGKDFPRKRLENIGKDVSSVNLFQTFPRHGFPQLVSTRLHSSYYFILNNTLIYLLIFL